MAQPSQEFPPWLTPSVGIITNGAGVPVSTVTSIVYVAPTYFGPSIPLGTLYSYGGSSFPPTVILPSAPLATTTAPPFTTTATPPSTTTQFTTTATPSNLPTPTSVSTISSATPTTSSISLSASSTFSLSLSNSLTSSTASFSSSSSATSSPPFTPTSSPTAPVGPVEATGLSKGQLVGVIVASILGLIFLFVLALFLYLWCKGRRSRRNFTTLDDDYYIIPPGARLPGEGSPRHSGEEADPFLQQSSGGRWAGAAAGGATGAAAMTQIAGPSASRSPVNRVPAPPTGSGSSADSNSNASGFGELLERPSLGLLPSMPEQTQYGGTALSDADENVLPDDHDQYGDPEYLGAYAYSADPLVPPRLITGDRPSPALFTPRQPFVPQPSHLSKKDSFSGDAEESATLLTARRVKVEDLGPRSVPSGPSHRSSNGLLESLGLSGLANIGRMGWFKNMDSPRQSVTEAEYTAAPVSEKDIETGRSMLSPEGGVDSLGNKARGVGTGPDGSRPKSNVSGRSGASAGTVYHDAHSSIPGTPLLAQPPRALTPAEQPLIPVTEHSWMSSPLSSPPPYNDRPLATGVADPTRSPTGTAFDDTPGADILDMPAPTALNHFSSISSLKETTTGSSFGYKATPFPPPGLETIRPIGWSDTSTDMTASVGSINMLSGSDNQVDITVDVLEEAPPDAEQGWRTISSGGFIDPGRRGTFGMLVHGTGFMSEQGSLHSMRSHFSPSIHGSTGSAPSRRDIGSLNSNSSRPSAHSVARSQGSGFSVAQSLVRTGSISSDERKRNSPALSAFGLQTRAAASSLSVNSRRRRSPSPYGYPEPPLSPVIGSPPSAHMSPDKATTIRSMRSGSTTLMADTSFGSTLRGGGVQGSRSASPLSASFPLNAPWVGGLDNDCSPLREDC
ncbi:hypothetical protein M413DRAFT_447231 [Hebeloma cylindrosporum]|uniref:Uncharacterized protein n=1 Tax=Hebeloma cylindrosporum TaxID=76867 RepID=A0A0C2YE41_HEBCY|nr:hypothetical protein M413DRAFT_447231 [Hebeloma cylindrosporum h7]